MLVRPRAETPTDTISDWLKVGRVRRPMEAIGCSYVMFPVYLQRIFTRSVSKNNAGARRMLDEHSDVIFIKIDQHLEKLYKENKGFPIFWNTV